MLQPRRPNIFPTELGLQRRRVSIAGEVLLYLILLPVLVAYEGADLLGRARNALKRQLFRNKRSSP